MNEDLCPAATAAAVLYKPATDAMAKTYGSNYPKLETQYLQLEPGISSRASGWATPKAWAAKKRRSAVCRPFQVLQGFVRLLHWGLGSGTESSKVQIGVNAPGFAARSFKQAHCFEHLLGFAWD